MKIHTQFVIDMATSEIIEDEYFEYSGEISEAKGGGTTTTKTDPPEWLEPYLKYGAEEATNLYETGGPQYYPGSTVTPYSDETEYALSGITDRALSGSEVLDSGNTLLNSTLQGNYLNSGPLAGINSTANNYLQKATGGGFLDSNPYLDSTFSTKTNQALNNINSQYAAAGRYGSGAQADSGARALGEIADQVYGQNYRDERNLQASAASELGKLDLAHQGLAQDAYNNERSRQQQGLMFAPTYAEQDYNDFQKLLGVGGARESLYSQYLQDDVNRYNFEQNAPYSNLANMMGILQGSGNGYSQSESQLPGGSKVAGAAGGALTAAALSSAMSTGGGAAAGASSGSFAGWPGMLLGALAGAYMA